MSCVTALSSCGSKLSNILVVSLTWLVSSSLVLSSSLVMSSTETVTSAL